MPAVFKVHIPDMPPVGTAGYELAVESAGVAPLAWPEGWTTNERLPKCSSVTLYLPRMRSPTWNEPQSSADCQVAPPSCETSVMVNDVTGAALSKQTTMSCGVEPFMAQRTLPAAKVVFV